MEHMHAEISQELTCRAPPSLLMSVLLASPALSPLAALSLGRCDRRSSTTPAPATAPAAAAAAIDGQCHGIGAEPVEKRDVLVR